MKLGFWNRLVVVALLAAASYPAMAEEAGPWDEFKELSYFNVTRSHAILTVSPNDVTRSDRTVTLWLRGDHTDDTTVEYRQSLTKMTFSCDGFFSTTAFTSYMADGSIDVEWDGSTFNRIAIRPGTITASLEKKFCSSK